MKLFLISLNGWGCNFKVVRAASAADALDRFADSSDSEITELDPIGDGKASVLWEHDYSPDSRP